MLKGVYAYDLPEGFMAEHPEVRLYPIAEDRQAYEHFSNPDQIDFLVARQGAVNGMLEVFTNIRWLQLLNAGYERVDLETLRRRGITFTNASSAYCGTIAEDVLCKMLALARNYRTHFLHQEQGLWPDDLQLANANVDLDGKTLGILGAGNIGREVAARAKAFGMQVIGYDPYVKSRNGFDRVLGGKGALDEVLGDSHFVVACLPVTDETKGIMNDRSFSLMRTEAFFINVSRGEVVDEAALAGALNGGKIRGAAIDVAKEEPLPACSALWKARNILITPHRAAYGDQMKKRMRALIERNILNWMKGKALENLVRY